MLTALFLAALQAPAAPCAYDRTQMLALDRQAFDQDPRGGWRILARDPACYLAAADLIRDYREAHRLTATTLYWQPTRRRASAASALTNCAG